MIKSAISCYEFLYNCIIKIPTEYLNCLTLCVVPVDASDIVRRFVESLFITHTETKLNTLIQLLGHQDNDN
jgi:hypothetical protein